MADLRALVRGEGFTLAPTADALFEWVEQFSETVALTDPYLQFYLLALLERSVDFRNAVRNFGGDPEAGAQIIRGEVEPDYEEPYGSDSLYSERVGDNLPLRPWMIHLAMQSAAADARRELQERDVVAAVLEFEQRMQEENGNRFTDPRLRVPDLMLANIVARFDSSLAVRLRDLKQYFQLRDEAVVTRAPLMLRTPLTRLLQDHPAVDRNAFVIMSFAATGAHQAILEAIRTALSEHEIEALRVDDRTYSEHLRSNIETYMHGCAFAIAVFERINSDDHNANVMYETGYMRALGKPVCLLKERTLRQLPSDLVGDLYVEFDAQRMPESIHEALTRWLRDRRIVS
jgi:hypothetical protein